MKFKYQRNKKICRSYQLTGKCNKQRCNKKHPDEIYNQLYLADMFIPEDVLDTIYEYSDIDTRYNLSMINKKFNKKYYSERIDIIKHYELIDESLKRLSDELNKTITTDYNRVKSFYDMKDSYGRWKGGIWEVFDQFECPYHGTHDVRMNFILNPRDVDLQSWSIDNNYSEYCIL